jgi:DNA-binding NarL/FixJ family response regulator
VNRARILLADDHIEVRKRIEHQLAHEFEVLDSVENGGALLAAAERLQPDVCLLDISMPGLNGIQTAIRLKENGSKAKIVFLTMHDDPDFLRAALKAGGSGYVLKERMVSDLGPAIEEAIAGRIFISPSTILGVEGEPSEDGQ